MADLVIKGMKMPKNCCYCAFVSYDNDHCTAKDKDIPIYGTKPSWCPLVLLPEKHGKLVDVDELKKLAYEIKTNRGTYQTVINIVDLINVPTIIEGERGVDNG